MIGCANRTARASARVLVTARSRLVGALAASLTNRAPAHTPCPIPPGRRPTAPRAGQHGSPYRGCPARRHQDASQRLRAPTNTSCPIRRRRPTAPPPLWVRRCRPARGAPGSPTNSPLAPTHEARSGVHYGRANGLV